MRTVKVRILPPQPIFPVGASAVMTWRLVVATEDPPREPLGHSRSALRAKPFPRRTFQYAREISRRNGAKAGTEYCKPWTSNVLTAIPRRAAMPSHVEYGKN